MNAADAVLKADERYIGHIMLVGKNVCHDIKNAQSGIWNGDEYKELFSKYHVKEEKRLHDMLACHEGIAYINGEDTFCEYDTVKPYNEGLCGTMTNVKR